MREFLDNFIKVKRCITGIDLLQLFFSLKSKHIIITVLKDVNRKLLVFFFLGICQFLRRNIKSFIKLAL